MRIHHLNCGTFCPRSARLVNGRGGMLASGHLSCHCLLIEAADGLVLVDTGLGMRDLAAPESRLGGMWSMAMRPDPDPAESALRRIEALGFDPAEVRHLVLTHLDFDHAGGLPDFPAAEVHVFEPEYQAARQPITPTEHFRYKAHHFAHQPRWVRYELEGDRWFGFESVRALGDREAEILLIPLVGHTRGHCGVAVRDGDGWLLHAGDAYFHHAELETRSRHAPPVTKLYERLMEIDRDERIANQFRLAALQREHGDQVRVICSHDPDQLPAEAAAQVAISRTRASERQPRP